MINDDEEMEDFKIQNKIWYRKLQLQVYIYVIQLHLKQWYVPPTLAF